MSQTPAVREPRQARGRETRDQILGAAEALLRTRTLEEITIGDIVREADASVGSFYHLFESKEAIIAPLYQRYDERITAETERIFRRARRTSRTMEARVVWLVRYAVRGYRRDRGLLRAMALHARKSDVTIEQHVHRSRFYERLAELLLEFKGEIPHSDPGQAIRLGLFFVAAACREKILFGNAPHPRSLRMGDRALADGLARALLAYLRDPFSPE